MVSRSTIYFWQTASEVATGAVLLQRQGPKSLLHTVAFSSQKMSQPKRNYDVGDQELFAIKTALEDWRYLHEGATHSIMIFTDHRNLEYLRIAKRLRPPQAWWALFFSRFNFHITYRPGSKNGKADALSRMFPDTPKETAPSTILSQQNFLSEGFTRAGFLPVHRTRGILLKKPERVPLTPR